MSAAPLHTPSPPAPASTPPRLRLVRPVPRRRRVGFAVLLSSIFTVAVFATVAINALAAGDAVAALQIERDVEEAESRYTELVAKVAKLEDPARIERVATKELGMIPARGARFLVVDRPAAEDLAAAPGQEDVSPRTDPLKPVLSVQR
ncbi:MAG: hypothetical protein M3252_07975 [Actinomycetota bacterium]|nr:hypothetical protein [Actinomycetota bacterium]